MKKVSNKAPISVEELLLQQSKQSEPSKKSKTPFVVDKNLEPVIDEYAQLVRDFKELEIKKNLKGEAILERSGTEYKKNSGKVTSFKFKGTKNDIVTVSHKNQFSKIEYDRELIETPKFDEYFVKKRTLTLKNPNDENITFVMNKLGPEKFAELFNVEMEIGVVDDMNERQFDANIPSNFPKYIKQYKASLKVG